MMSMMNDFQNTPLTRCDLINPLSKPEHQSDLIRRKIGWREKLLNHFYRDNGRSFFLPSLSESDSLAEPLASKSSS